MNTHESYVSIETAKMLKKAGFDWETVYAYDLILYDLQNEIGIGHDDFTPHNQNSYEGLASRPTLSIAQKWLREVKKKHIEPRYYPSSPYSYKEGWMWHAYNHNPPYESKYMDGDGFFDTYESALEAGIKKVLELILEKGE